MKITFIAYLLFFATSIACAQKADTTAVKYATTTAIDKTEKGKEKHVAAAKVVPDDDKGMPFILSDTACISRLQTAQAYIRKGNYNAAYTLLRETNFTLTKRVNDRLQSSLPDRIGKFVKTNMDLLFHVFEEFHIPYPESQGLISTVGFYFPDSYNTHIDPKQVSIEKVAQDVMNLKLLVVEVSDMINNPDLIQELHVVKQTPINPHQFGFDSLEPIHVNGYRGILTADKEGNIRRIECVLGAGGVKIWGYNMANNDELLKLAEQLNFDSFSNVLGH